MDLAGSERFTKTGAEGGTAREAMHINKSLTFLEQGLAGRQLSDAAHCLRLVRRAWFPWKRPCRCIKFLRLFLVLLNVAAGMDMTYACAWQEQALQSSLGHPFLACT